METLGQRIKTIGKTRFTLYEEDIRHHIFLRIYLLSVAAFSIILVSGASAVQFNLSGTDLSSFLMATAIFRYGFLSAAIALFLLALGGYLLSRNRSKYAHAAGFAFSLAYIGLMLALSIVFYLF